ncbi:MAG: hypothetical protein IPK83_02310 [Planctomycetes bacterium]|nr:hypothetical protein [Planctomycetota bacterium]
MMLNGLDAEFLNPGGCVSFESFAAEENDSRVVEMRRAGQGPQKKAVREFHPHFLENRIEQSHRVCGGAVSLLVAGDEVSNQKNQQNKRNRNEDRQKHTREIGGIGRAIIESTANLLKLFRDPGLGKHVGKGDHAVTSCLGRAPASSGLEFNCAGSR